jgi:hypothetical protein
MVENVIVSQLIEGDNHEKFKLLYNELSKIIGHQTSEIVRSLQMMEREQLIEFRNALNDIAAYASV